MLPNGVGEGGSHDCWSLWLCSVHCARRVRRQGVRSPCCRCLGLWYHLHGYEDRPTSLARCAEGRRRVLRPLSRGPQGRGGIPTYRGVKKSKSSSVMSLHRC